MKTKTTKVNKTPQQRHEDEKKARINYVRFLAFTGIYDYERGSDFSLSSGFLKGDVTKATEYYIGKKWMSGTATRASSYTKTCQLNDIRICPIIAFTPIEETEKLLTIAAQINSQKYYWEKDEDAEETRQLLAYSLNCYCRAFPETLSSFSDMDDFPCDMPTEEEIESARKLWEKSKTTLGNIENDISDIPFLCHIFKNPAFKEFFRALPVELLIIHIEQEIIKYEKLQFLNKEDYKHVMSMLEYDDHTPYAALYDYTADNIMFFNDFLRNGNIGFYKERMHYGSLGMLLIQAIGALQNELPNDALKLIEAHLKKNKHTIFDDGFSNFIYGLALLQSDTAASYKKAETLMKKKDIRTDNSIPYFKLLLQMKIHPETDFTKWIPNNLNCANTSPFGAAMLALLCVHYRYSDRYNETASKYAEIFIKEGIKVLALDFAKDVKIFTPFADKLQEEAKMKPLLPQFKHKETWEAIIDTMMQKYDDSSSSALAKSAASVQEVSRVSYLVNMHNYYVQPRLQKSKNGGTTWSTGRNIALKSFQKGIPEMTSQDTRVALLVENYSYGWYGGSDYTLEGPKVIEALVGHPYVFDANNHDLKIEIQTDKLQIQVKEVAKGYEISKNVQPANSGTYDSIYVHEENAQLLKVVNLSTEEKDMLALLDRVKVFPKEAKPKLTQLLTTLGKKVTIMSPLLNNAENIKQKKGDSKLTIQLVPYGELFTARCFVKPLVTTAPYCTPGKGLEFIAANVKGETVQVARNLAAERNNLKSFNEWMEPFDEYESGDGWQMPIESCLEVLELLRQHSDICNIEWPEGVRFRISRPALNPEAISLSVKGIGHWFEVEGEVKIDDKAKMKVSDLLNRVRESKGRFIQIGDDEYVALSEQLRKQLSSLDRLMQSDHKTQKIASYNTTFLQDLVNSGAKIHADNSYNEMLAKMEEADTMKFSVPRNLQADLRDYQKEGFRWLCRLAHWGAGACLADDMGLGKTIQTIALLLSKAKEGASLVIMPTSVLLNWKNELTRFAPSLNPIIMRDSNDRAETVNNAGAQDVVLATYGLLPTEEDILTAKKWNVIVLDEAHTIKNKDTKTSKVSMQLEGNFRLILTGTPLQNHLSEIWNLFQFATPGLLTGYTQFTREFITPIEKDHIKEPQRLLKRMLQPFILRRTKNEVLNELPEKTEITLKVELSDAERALYDRFREEAVLNLEEGSTTAIKALAELTKLRQTACNPALVLPAKEAKNIPSSKMETFLKLVDELIHNHHRALVFSQFTSHLALVEKELKRLKVDYQYLDGSVSPSERIKRVSEFQKGDMPLFLISLKAGGTGLNLTAADYVIHLDPWWNPAIEDQASDRAYRIGQDKPVTVYRLIAENTIEEKIIALHQTKKSLADALLEGSDMAYALGKDEILNLIRGN